MNNLIRYYLNQYPLHIELSTLLLAQAITLLYQLEHKNKHLFSLCTFARILYLTELYHTAV